METGSKACEFLAHEHLVPHTEVSDEEGLRWPKLLAKQEEREANNCYTHAQQHYDEAIKEPCGRYSPGHPNRVCPGKPIIRALSGEKDVHKRLFVGCSLWKPREKNHRFVACRNLDPIAVLQVWRKAQYEVPQKFLDQLVFKWDDVEGIDFQFQFETNAYIQLRKMALFVILFMPIFKAQRPISAHFIIPSLRMAQKFVDGVRLSHMAAMFSSIFWSHDSLMDVHLSTKWSSFASENTLMLLLHLAKFLLKFETPT
jgi:hypothetical protein